MSQSRLIRLPEVLKRTGYTRSTWYRLLGRDERFPRGLRLDILLEPRVPQQDEALVGPRLKGADHLGQRLVVVA